MRKPITVLAVAGAAVAVLLAGCGGGGNPNTVASVSSPSRTSGNAPAPDGNGTGGKGDDLDKERAYAKCMRDHGYDMKDPGPGEAAGIRPDDPKFAPAEEACKSLEPTSTVNPDDPAFLDKERKYATCMRDHGVDIPDPKPGEGMPMANGDDPKAMAAIKACQSIMG